MVLEGTFLFTIHGFRDIKRLRWLIWLIIHGYFRQGVTTSTLDLFSRISSIAILLLLLWLLLRLLQLVTWFEEKTNFFLSGTRHFQLFTSDNQKIIRWLWTVISCIAKPCTHLHLAPSISTNSIHLHPALPSSIHLHPAQFNLYPALCNTLNVIRTKTSHEIG